jgi:3-oxoacyl-[acyl-carrier-protein] synthase-3
VHAQDIFIAGVGVFVPETTSVAEAVEAGKFSAEDAECSGLLGVSVAGTTPAPEMALSAAREALARARRTGEDIDVLLYASSWHHGPDGWLPQSYLQRHLGGDGLAVEVRLGCNGMFGGLELASAYLRADPRRRSALVVAADNFGTPMMDRWSSGSGFIPADAASAVVLTTDPAFARLRSACSVTVAGAEQVHRGDEPLFPPSVTVGRPVDFSARLSAFRDHIRTQPDGMAPLLEVQKKSTEIVDLCLSEAGVELAQISRVSYNNFSREMVEGRVMTSLGIPMSRSTWDYGRRIGHGANDQIIALNHLLEVGELPPGDHLLMLGVAPGITLSGAVVEVLDTPPWVK